MHEVVTTIGWCILLIQAHLHIAVHNWDTCILTLQNDIFRIGAVRTVGVHLGKFALTWTTLVKGTFRQKVMDSGDLVVRRVLGALAHCIHHINTDVKAEVCNMATVRVVVEGILAHNVCLASEADLAFIGCVGRFGAVVNVSTLHTQEFQ